MNDNMIISLKEPPPAPPAPAPVPTASPALPPLEQKKERPLPPKPRRRRSVPLKNITKGALVAALGVLCSAGAYAYSHAPQRSGSPSASAAASVSSASVPQSAAAPSSASETASIIEAVGRLIELPEGEAPTVAIVSDPTKLKGQTFFDHATIGDVVLMYVRSGKAILYDPSQNKIVDVASLSISGAAAQP